MTNKSLFFSFLILFCSAAFADCKKPFNWASPKALTNYEDCLKKNKIEPQARPKIKTATNPCSILSDGSYRCKPAPLRFFEKSSLPSSATPTQTPQQNTEGGEATFAIPPPPPAVPVQN